MKLRSTMLIFTVLAAATLTWAARADEKDKPQVLPSTPDIPLPASEVLSGKERTYQIETGLYQGDPLGRLERGTLKCLASAKFTTPTFSCVAGHSDLDGSYRKQLLPSGVYANIGYTLRFRVAPDPTNAEHIRLTVVVDSTEQVCNTDHSAHLLTEQFSFIETVKAGEMIKLRLGKPSLDNQTWLEVKVQPLEEPKIIERK